MFFHVKRAGPLRGVKANDVLLGEGHGVGLVAVSSRSTEQGVELRVRRRVMK